VTPVETNARDGNTELLKLHPWTLLEVIDGLFETTDFILPPEQYKLEVARYIPHPEDPHIRRHFFISNWNKGQDKLTVTENKILMEFIRATSENVSK